jgi:hypothetical protein
MVLIGLVTWAFSKTGARALLALGTSPVTAHEMPARTILIIA